MDSTWYEQTSSACESIPLYLQDILTKYYFQPWALYEIQAIACRNTKEGEMRLDCTTLCQGANSISRQAIDRNRRDQGTEELPEGRDEEVWRILPE